MSERQNMANGMILGISGFAGSGKDTAAEFLIKNFGFGRIGLADELKRICYRVFDFSEEQLWGPSSARNAMDLRYPREHTWATDGSWQCFCCGAVKNAPEEEMPKCYLTPRFALQRLGTEWGRHCYDDIWIDHALQTAKQLVKFELSYSAKTGLHEVAATCRPSPVEPWSSCYSNVTGVTFSDIRFHNEVRSVRRHGGKLIRLKRNTSLDGAASNHASEKEMLEMKDEDFDLVIDNSDITLEELEARVSEAYRCLC